MRLRTLGFVGLGAGFALAFDFFVTGFLGTTFASADFFARLFTSAVDAFLLRADAALPPAVAFADLPAVDFFAELDRLGFSLLLAAGIALADFTRLTFDAGFAFPLPAFPLPAFAAGPPEDRLAAVLPTEDCDFADFDVPDRFALLDVAAFAVVAFDF